MPRVLFCVLSVCCSASTHAADLFRTDAHAHWQDEQILISSQLPLKPELTGGQSNLETTTPDSKHSLAAEMLFAPNGVNIVNANGLPPLLRDLQQQPVLRVVVTGYTDNTGTARYNQRLSLRRATAVIQVLRQAAPQHHYIAQGYGEAQPVASNRDAEGRAKNRHVIVEARP